MAAALETQPLEQKTFYHLDTVNGPVVCALEDAIAEFNLPDTTTAESMTAYVARHRSTGMKAEEVTVPVYVLKDDADYIAQASGWEWDTVVVHRRAGKNEAVATRTFSYGPVPGWPTEQGVYVRALTALFNSVIRPSDTGIRGVDYADLTSATYSVVFPLPNHLFEYTVEEALRGYEDSWVEELVKRVAEKNVVTLVPDAVLEEADKLTATDLAIAKSVVANTGTSYTLAEQVALAAAGSHADPVTRGLTRDTRTEELSHGFIRAV